jgi:putative aminopeptidase FrvX
MSTHVDMSRTLSFLTAHLQVPSPTGYHEEAVAFVREALQRLDPWG